jgi:hypothetical protein
MSLFIEKFDEAYQDLVGINSPSQLHRNSLELLDILLEHELILDGIKIFEIGAGGCRNLKYINDYNPNVLLFANDLHKEASLNNCHPSIKSKVQFYEMDTFSLINENELEVDVLIASDHLMHIDPETTGLIVEQICKKWKPKYILLREVTEWGHKPLRVYPRFHHKFQWDGYELLTHRASITDPHLYYVQLWRLIQAFPAPDETPTDDELDAITPDHN